MLIGYARVPKSCSSQTLDLQKDDLLSTGVDDGHFYTDQTSGKRDARPSLDACLKELRTDDILVVWGAT